MPYKKNALVSIIMPNYNCSDYIGRSIESVIAQSYPHWELIIVDDKSTDESIKVIRRYVDKRICLLVNKKNGGPSYSRNRGIRAAKGDYIAFLDSDDWWYPHKLSRQVRFMREHGIALSYGSFDIVNEAGKKLATQKVKSELTYSDILWHHRLPNLTAMYDVRQLGKRYQDAKLRYAVDYPYWLDILKEQYVAHGLKEALGAYTVRKESVSSNKRRMAKRVWDILLRRENVPLWRAVFYFADYMLYGCIATLKHRFIHR